MFVKDLQLRLCDEEPRDSLPQNRYARNRSYFIVGENKDLKVLMVRNRLDDDLTEEQFFDALGGANSSESPSVLPVRFRRYEAVGEDSAPVFFLPVVYWTDGRDNSEHWRPDSIAVQRARMNEGWERPLSFLPQKFANSVLFSVDAARSKYPYSTPVDFEQRRLLRRQRRSGISPLRDEDFSRLEVEGMTYSFSKMPSSRLGVTIGNHDAPVTYEIMESGSVGNVLARFLPFPGERY